MLRKILFRRRKKVPLKATLVPMVDYTHLAYRSGTKRRIGRIVYVDYHEGEPIHYVQIKELVTAVTNSQIINRFGKTH